MHVPRNVKVERPIEVIWLTTEASAPDIAAHLRNVVVAEAGSEVSLVEAYVSQNRGPYLTNLATEIFVGAGRLGEPHPHPGRRPGRFRTSPTPGSSSQRDARAHVSRHGTTGARTSRNDLGFALTEPGASCVLNGLFVLNGHQHADNFTTFVDHAGPQLSEQRVLQGCSG